MENKEYIRQPTPEELLLIEHLTQKAQYMLDPINQLAYGLNLSQKKELA